MSTASTTSAPAHVAASAAAVVTPVLAHVAASAAAVVTPVPAHVAASAAATPVPAHVAAASAAVDDAKKPRRKNTKPTSSEVVATFLQKFLGLDLKYLRGMVVVLDYHKTIQFEAGGVCAEVIKLLQHLRSFGAIVFVCSWAHGVATARNVESDCEKLKSAGAINDYVVIGGNTKELSKADFSAHVAAFVFSDDNARTVNACKKCVEHCYHFNGVSYFNTFFMKELVKLNTQLKKNPVVFPSPAEVADGFARFKRDVLPTILPAAEDSKDSKSDE